MSPKHPELTLEELALRAQQGDKELYFAELVERLSGRLKSFLLRKTNHSQDVDDLVQETFLRAYSNLDSYQSTWRFSTWLFTIASRLASNQHRADKYNRQRHTRSRSPDELADENLASEVMARERRVRLWTTAREHLDATQYTVLWLHYAKDMSVKDIAGVMGKTTIHIKVILYRARRKLAAEVEPCAAE